MWLLVLCVLIMSNIVLETIILIGAIILLVDTIWVWYKLKQANKKLADLIDRKKGRNWLDSDDDADTPVRRS